MGRESVNAKHEFLELWAILERQKVWLSISNQSSVDPLNELETERRIACLRFLDSQDLLASELRDLRNTIAHYDPTIDQWDVSGHSAILRRLNEIILGRDRFDRLWNRLQSEWSQEKFATRRQRQDLLRRWEDLFDGLLDYWDLMPEQRASISEKDFERSKKARHSSSHPNPPPLSREVSDVMAIFRGYSTKLRQKKKSQEKIETARAAEESAARAEVARRLLEEAKRNEREQLVKKRAQEKEAAANAERLRRQEQEKLARESAKSLKQAQKAQASIARENFRSWAVKFHEEAIVAADNKEHLTTAQRKHLRISRRRSYMSVVWALLVVAPVGLILVFMSFFFPPLFLVSWVFIVVYLFGHLLVNLGIPTWMIACIYAAALIAVGEYCHRRFGSRYVTSETKFAAELNNQH